MQHFFFLHFRQLGCHNSFFFFPPIFGNLVSTIHIFSLLIPTISATWFPQFIFSLSSSLQFRQLGCHNCFLFRALPLACTWCTSWAELGQNKNFGNLITKIQFSLSPDALYFFLQFRQHCCRNSISFLILPNNFEQYL